MSKIDQDIRAGMAALLNPGELIISGKVLAYNATQQTVDIDLLDGRTRYNVSLKASQGGQDGILLQPKVGAMIIAARVSNTKRHVLLNCDALEQIQWKIGDYTLVLTEEGFVFNGGSLNGMVKIDALLQKINQLEQKLSSHQHGYVSPGGPAVTTPDPGATQLITPVTTYEDLANDKIRQ